jgi:RNA polymerase sigma-70 factor (ECF subfamily)
MTVHDDETLVPQAQAGDQRAFGALVRRHQERVFRFIARLCASREDAMELTQETFMKAYQALPGWQPQPQAQWRTWLLRIAHNTTLDLLRRRQLVRFVPYDDPADDAQHLALPDPAPRPDEQLAQRQNVARLERVLLELPIEQREVLLLREIEDLSYAEIAATLGVAEGTVKSRLARARAAALAGYQGLTGERRHD